jgi:hypothetical protein
MRPERDPILRRRAEDFALGGLFIDGESVENCSSRNPASTSLLVVEDVRLESIKN